MVLPREIEGIQRRESSDKHNVYSRNTRGLLKAFALLMLSFLLGSCEAVGEVFKAGMSFGIFIVVAIVIAVIVLVMRMGRNKSS